LLEIGTIEEVLKKTAARRTIAVRLLNREQTPLLLKELLQTPLVDNPREVGAEVHFELAGEDTAACDILNVLIARQFRVLEFHQTKADLEDTLYESHQGRVE
jgi:hypothetical protein